MNARRTAPMKAMLTTEHEIVTTAWLIPGAFGRFRELGLSDSTLDSETARHVYRVLRDHYSATEVPPTERALRLRMGDRAGLLDEFCVPKSCLSFREEEQVWSEFSAQRALRACERAAKRAGVAVTALDFDTALALIADAKQLKAEADGGDIRPAEPRYPLLAESIQQTLKPLGQRLETGFPTLDDAVRGGVLPGRLLALLGAPGAGKTGLAVFLMHVWELAGCAVLYLAADEPAEAIITRLGQLSGFSRDSLESDTAAGLACRGDFAAKSLGRGIVVLDPDADDSMCTIEDAHAALEHFACERPRVLIVDSLQTAQCAAADGAESLRERIDAKQRVLKGLAKRGTLVVAISEMARAGYRSGDRSQDISALASGKESGSIEYGCSLLLGLRSVKGTPGAVDVEVAKNRLGGGKPEFRLKLDFESACFAEVELPEQAEREDAKADVRMEQAKKRVRKAVMANWDLSSQRQLLAKCDGGREANRDAINEMVRIHELTHVEGYWRLSNPSKEAWHAAE